MTTHDAPLEEAATTLQLGKLSPRAYVDDLLDRIETVDPEVEALVPEPDRADRLRSEAAAITDRFPAWRRPPLYGVPVGVKDIFHVDGLPTRAGSTLPPAALAGAQADAVSTLRAAGALVLGKTVTTEFAYFEPGPTRNPHDTSRTPGGSSSGSAAAVAAGLCPLALGSQTVGSTLRPASFCGIVGFKPSFGRIPLDGVIPLAASVDHVGLFTQDVPGMRRAAGVVCADWEPSDTRHVDDPTIGVPAGPYLEQASDAGLEAFERLVGSIEEAGYAVRRVEVLDDVDAINDRHEDMVAAEAALAHERWYEDHGDRYRGGTRELIEDGRDVDVGRLARSRRGRLDLRRRFADRMAEYGVDLWVSPAAPGPAPEGIDDTGDPAMNLPWTHAGLPAASLPVGEVDGLPFGLQCAARYGADESLLEWSEALVGAL